MNAATAEHGRRGFSLIEVVLAVGVVAFAIITILALFGSSLQSSRNVIDEDEALGVARALPAYLQAQGFSTVYNWIISPATAPSLFGYTILPSPLALGTDTAQQSVVYSGTDTNLTAPATSYLTKRQGRLFAIQLSLSPNMPIHSGTTPNASIINLPTVANLPSASTSYPESILAIRASILPVSGTNGIPQGTYPAFVYDTAISR